MHISDMVSDPIIGENTMLYVITGGSGSGKSEYAEKLATHLKGDETLHYVATMYPYDDAETRERIAKHRAMRKDKGFITLEKPLAIGELKANKDIKNILLECMSNLVANEMYNENGKVGFDETSKNKCDEHIIEPILNISTAVDNMIIVTNEVFSDGNTYDESTEKYVELLGYINQRLSKKADGVIEVFCGIPIAIKGDLPC